MISVMRMPEARRGGHRLRMRRRLSGLDIMRFTNRFCNESGFVVRFFRGRKFGNFTIIKLTLVDVQHNWGCPRMAIEHRLSDVIKITA